jgi:hypothetical protein
MAAKEGFCTSVKLTAINTVCYIETQTEHVVHKGTLITISPSYRNLMHLRVTHPVLNAGSQGNPTTPPHLAVIPTIKSFALMTSCKDAKLWSCNSRGVKINSSFRNKQMLVCVKIRNVLTAFNERKIQRLFI